jgi:hypothetical protein
MGIHSTEALAALLPEDIDAGEKTMALAALQLLGGALDDLHRIADAVERIAARPLSQPDAATGNSSIVGGAGGGTMWHPV